MLFLQRTFQAESILLGHSIGLLRFEQLDLRVVADHYLFLNSGLRMFLIQKLGRSVRWVDSVARAGVVRLEIHC